MPQVLTPAQKAAATRAKNAAAAAAAPVPPAAAAAPVPPAAAPTPPAPATPAEAMDPVLDDMPPPTEPETPPETPAPILKSSDKVKVKNIGKGILCMTHGKIAPGDMGIMTRAESSVHYKSVAVV